MYHYSVPPQGWTTYSYPTSASTSPSNSPPPQFKYYAPAPQYASPVTSPNAKRHSKKASYSSPQTPGGWHSPVGYPSPVYRKTQPDFVYQEVSAFDRVPTRARRSSSSAKRDYEGPRRHASVQSQKQRVVYVDTSDEAEDAPTFGQYRPRAQPKSFKPKPATYTKSRADKDFFLNQEPVVGKDLYDSQAKSRPRRSSQSRPSTATKPSKPPPAREATAADAAKYRIPAGYSLKNWDPTESPVLLLGSVFDANSLGKWIYDWTVFRQGPDTPLSEVAGDLWLLLIKLSHKMKRADECLPRVRSPDNQELLEDFLESGDRLWDRFKKLLRSCEEYMWRAAKKEGAKGNTIKMGKNSGCEFVDSMFGRDRRLEETESLMQGVRLWNMRFDTNCEDILRRPAAV